MRSLTFWNILSCFDTYSWVETFSDVLGCSVVFRGILMCFERFLIHLDTFSLVLSGNEGFLYVLSISLKFWEVSEAFQGVLISFERF